MSTEDPPIEIAVYFEAAGYYGDPFDGPGYEQAYLELADLLAARGARLTVVREQRTYKGGNVFEGGWKHDGKAFVRIEGQVTYDVIFNRGTLTVDKKAVVVNDPEFDAFCTDKWKSYLAYQDLYPKTVLVEKHENLDAAISAMRTKRIVAKPLYLEGGEGVFIGSSEEIRASVKEFPYLIQEFIDTSGGIPGLTKGHHDFRIVSVRGEIVELYYRVPKAGSLIANFSRGGTMHFLTPDKMPSDALKIFQTVDASLSRFSNRIYAVDMGREKDGTWKIIELNARPGINPRSWHETVGLYLERIADVSVDTARESQRP